MSKLDQLPDKYGKDLEDVQKIVYELRSAFDSSLTPVGPEPFKANRAE